MWSVLNCLDILSEDKDAATSSTADSLLKNIFCFNFVLGIMVPNSVLISIVYLHLLSTAVPAAAAHLPRAQPEVGAGRGGDQPVRGGDTLGCRVSATMVAVWMLCEKYRFDLANLASVPTSLVGEIPMCILWQSDICISPQILAGFQCSTLPHLWGHTYFYSTV